MAQTQDEFLGEIVDAFFESEELSKAAFKVLEGKNVLTAAFTLLMTENVFSENYPQWGEAMKLARKSMRAMKRMTEKMSEPTQ